MLKITDNMQEIAAEENAVVYFTASWCQPCKQLKPIYAKAGMTDENINYFVVDIDFIDKEYQDLYNIRSVPTIIQMSHGKEERRILSRSAEAIIEEVNTPF